MTKIPYRRRCRHFPRRRKQGLFLLSLRGKRSDEANSREGEFPCHCEPQARQSPGIKHVILSASEIFPPNHRNTHYIVFASVPRQTLFLLSLRGSVATAAIRWNEVRSIYRVLFQGDRHACARDDTENQLSLRQCQESKLACKGLRTTVFMKR